MTTSPVRDATASIDLRKLAGELRAAFLVANNTALSGTPYARAVFERMGDPRPGDLVVEWTMTGRTPDIDAVGYLERVTQEPIKYAYPWDETVEGQPNPTEKVHYIRNLEGREIRWTGCRFLAAITTPFFGMGVGDGTPPTSGRSDPASHRTERGRDDDASRSSGGVSGTMDDMDAVMRALPDARSRKRPGNLREPDEWDIRIGEGLREKVIATATTEPGAWAAARERLPS